MQAKESFERFRQLCIKVTNYYIEERYPLLVGSDINKDDLKDVIKQTTELIKLINAT